MTAANLDFVNLLTAPEGGIVNEDVIQQLMTVDSPPVLPFTSRVGKTSASNKFAEWTQDRLADAAEPLAAANKVNDGYVSALNDASIGQRVGNHNQISVKDIEVSSGANASSTIGFANALAYQISKNAKSLSMDIEANMLANVGSVLEVEGGAAGASAGMEAWIDGKVLIPGLDGTSGYNTELNRIDQTAGSITGGGWSATADGLVAPWTYLTATPVALTEANLQTVMQALYTNTRGRNNDRVLMTAAPLHTRISQYYFSSTARVATFTAETSQQGPATAMGAVNKILTDYGMLSMVPNANMNAADTADSTPVSYTAFFLDFSTIKLASLRAMQVESIGKLGLSDRRLLSHYWTLKPLTTEDQGMIQGIDAAVAMTAA